MAISTRRCIHGGFASMRGDVPSMRRESVAACRIGGLAGSRLKENRSSCWSARCRLATVPGLGGHRREVLIDIAERAAGLAKVVPAHLRTRLR